MKEQEDKLNFESKPTICLHDIEDSLQQVYNNYKVLLAHCNYLMEENKRLKSEAYKDEELYKMKDEYDRMKKDYLRGFPISNEQYEKIAKWLSKYKDRKNSYHYEFYPTSIGVKGVIIDDLSKEKFVFQDL